MTASASLLELARQTRPGGGEPDLLTLAKQTAPNAEKYIRLDMPPDFGNPDSIGTADLGGQGYTPRNGPPTQAPAANTGRPIRVPGSLEASGMPQDVTFTQQGEPYNPRTVLPTQVEERMGRARIDQQVASEFGPVGRFGQATLAATDTAIREAGATWQNLGSQGVLPTLMAGSSGEMPHRAEQYTGIMDEQTRAANENIAAQATGAEHFLAGLASMPATFLDPRTIAAMILAKSPAGPANSFINDPRVFGVLEQRIGRVGAETVKSMVENANVGGAFGGMDAALRGGNMLEGAAQGAITSVPFGVAGAVRGIREVMRSPNNPVVAPEVSRGGEEPNANRVPEAPPPPAIQDLPPDGVTSPVVGRNEQAAPNQVPERVVGAVDAPRDLGGDAPVDGGPAAEPRPVDDLVQPPQIAPKVTESVVQDAPPAAEPRPESVVSPREPGAVTEEAIRARAEELAIDMPRMDPQARWEAARRQLEAEAGTPITQEPPREVQAPIQATEVPRGQEAGEGRTQQGQTGEAVPPGDSRPDVLEPPRVKKVSSEVRGLSTTTDGTTVDSYEITHGSVKVNATVFARPDGTLALNIHASEGGTLGTRAVLQLRNILRKLYPNATRIVGERVGTTGGPEGRPVDIALKPKVVKPSQATDNPYVGEYNAASKSRDAAWKRVKELRTRVKEVGPQAGQLRLDLLKAESAHREAVKRVRDARKTVEARAQEVGETTKPTPDLESQMTHNLGARSQVESQLKGKPPTLAEVRRQIKELGAEPIKGPKAKLVEQLEGLKKGAAAGEKVAVNPPEVPVEPPKPTEPDPPGPEPTQTSARMADMDLDRKAMGLDSINSPERRGWETALSEAKSKGLGTPDKAAALIHEINNKPRSLNDTETAGLVLRATELKNQHRGIMEEVAKLTDDSEIRTKGEEARRIEQDFDALSQALRSSGTEKGRALAAQKLTLDEDMSLIAVKARARAAKGSALTPAETARIEMLTKSLEEANAKITELQNKSADGRAEKAVRRGTKRTTEAKRLAEYTDLLKQTRELLKAGCL